MLYKAAQIDETIALFSGCIGDDFVCIRRRDGNVALAAKLLIVTGLQVFGGEFTPAPMIFNKGEDELGAQILVQMSAFVRDQGIIHEIKDRFQLHTV